MGGNLRGFYKENLEILRLCVRNDDGKCDNASVTRPPAAPGTGKNREKRPFDTRNGVKKHSRGAAVIH